MEFPWEAGFATSKFSIFSGYACNAGFPWVTYLSQVSANLDNSIIMQGTSPFAYNSPSFHSSSYLPKLEANFMKDFSCCGLVLPSLHDLLQHYEESHAHVQPPSTPRQQAQHIEGPPNTKAAIATNTASAVQRQAQLQTASTANHSPPGQLPANGTGVPRNQQQHPQYRTGEFARTPHPPVQDMDDVVDMEMDDIGDGEYSGIDSTQFQQTQFPLQNRSHIPPRSQFGQPTSARVPPLDLNALNLGNPLQAHQGLRNSQPTTPVSGGRPGGMYSNNPTVSSVNTPTLSAHPLQQQFRNSPDSSAPGTPAELDADFLGIIGNMSMTQSQQFMHGQQQAFGGYGFGNGNDMLDLCIDEPAKRLFSPGGFNLSSNPSQNRLGGAQYGPNSEIAQRIREQQRRVGLADTVSGLNGEEPKPFRCPVIGCEKAYKNQNGLKYHKSVSHALMCITTGLQH